MEALVEKGLVRSLGVSNFNSEQLDRLLSACTIKPVMNQVEVSPALNQRKLIKYCKDRGIEVTAYSPLGRPNFTTKTPDYIFDEEVVAIGKKYGKSTAQVVLRYLVSRHSRCIMRAFLVLISSSLETFAGSIERHSNPEVADKRTHPTKHRYFRFRIDRHGT